MNGVVIGDQQLVEVCVKVVLVIALTRTLCGVVLDAIDLRMIKDGPHTLSLSLSLSRALVSKHPSHK